MIESIKNLWHYGKAYQKYQWELKISKSSQIRFFNFWKQKIKDYWFYRFIQSRSLLKSYPDIVIDFFSVFGEKYVLDWAKGDIKIFFTGENVQWEHLKTYSDHTLSNKNIDLSLGFEYLSDERYFRFPFWVTTYLLSSFLPELDKKGIIMRCKELSSPLIEERPKFASHISRWDKLGIRKNICEALMNIDQVDCAGTFMHNDDTLWQQYGDDKIEYLRNYKFSICPENSNCNGYVTEKVFQTIKAGCIPVYWGSDNNPEPEILNHEAILFWNAKGNNEGVLKTIEELNRSPKLLRDFMMQPRLKENAAEKVIALFEGLETRIKAIIERKGRSNF